MDKVRRRMGFSNGFFLWKKKKRRGRLAVLWKENVNLKVESFSVGHIDAIIAKNVRVLFGG